LAKIASDVNKPDGIFVIPPSNVENFVLKLPVGKIFGVGKVTQAKMRGMNIETCADLRRLSIFELSEHFGSQGKQLYELCRGIDDRIVQPKRRRKSISVEHTYPDDLETIAACLAKIPALYVNLRSRLNKLNSFQRTTKVFAKVKFMDFTTTTIEKTGKSPTQKEFEELIADAVQRKNLPVRLLGIGVRFVDEKEVDEAIKLELFEKFPELMPEH
jgi:DNA polymerase-4